MTKPGGRVLLVAYGSPGEFEALQFFLSALQVAGPDFEVLPDPPPLEYQVSDPTCRAGSGRRGSEGRAGGHHQQELLELSTGQEAWDWTFFSNPIAGTILDDVGASEDDRATMRAALSALLNVGWGRKADGR